MTGAAYPRTGSRPPTPASTAGFTLLEIMVAMVVLALIVTTAFGAVRLGERSWEAGHARSTEIETMRSVAGVLQRQFNQILPLTWDRGTETILAFSGNRERVRFIAPAPQHRGATGLFEYTLTVETDGDDARLVLDYRLHDPDLEGFAADGSEPQRVLLVDQLKSASFAYYGAPVADEPADWYSQWSFEAEAYPRLVQARLVRQDHQPQWPELLLALQTGLVK